VRLDDKNIYVSNYLREISIPVTDIKDVKEVNWVNHRRVTIYLKSNSEFGQAIKFIPTALFAFWSEAFSGSVDHPVVYELRRLAALEGR